MGTVLSHATITAARRDQNGCRVVRIALVGVAIFPSRDQSQDALSRIGLTEGIFPPHELSKRSTTVFSSLNGRRTWYRAHFFLLSTTTNLADASVRGFTSLVNTAVCVWYVGGYVTQLRPAHNQIHQMLALGGPAKWDKWMRALVSSSVRIPELGLGNFSPDAVVCIGGDRRL
jgi:hypothetical protein